MALGPYIPSLRSLDNERQTDIRPPNVTKFRKKRPSVHAPSPNNRRKSKPEPKYPDWWHDMTEREQKLYLMQHPHSKHKLVRREDPVPSPHTQKNRPSNSYDEHKKNFTDLPHADPEQAELMRQLHGLKPEERHKVEHEAEQVAHAFRDVSTENLFSRVDKSMTEKQKSEFDELLHLRNQVDSGHAFDPEELEPANTSRSIMPKRAKSILKKFALATMLAAGGGLLVAGGAHAMMVAALAQHHLHHEHGIDVIGPMWEKLRRKPEHDEHEEDNPTYARSRRQTSMHKLVKWMKDNMQSNRIKDDELIHHLRQFKYK